MGLGGGSCLLGQSQLLMIPDSGSADTLSLDDNVSPIVGKFLEIMPSIVHACFDMNSLLVESVKYTIWRVVGSMPDGDVPVKHRGRAPMMFIALLLAAVICILAGTRDDLLIFSVWST